MDNLGSFVNVQSLGIKLAKIGLAKDKTVTARDILKLYKHLEWDAVLALFDLDQQTIDTYFDTAKLKRFMKYLNDDDALELKAAVLPKCFKIPAWEQALECTNLQPALKNLCKLHYFTGTQEEKHALIRLLKQDITNLRPANAVGTLTYENYFNVPALQALLDQMLEGKKVTQAEILRTLYLQKIINTLSPNNDLHKTFHMGHLIPFALSLLMSESQEGLPTELVFCLRWDTLVDHLPTLLGWSQEELERVVHCPNLKKLLQEFQAGKGLTQPLVRSVVQDSALSTCGVERDIEDYVDFGKLTEGLNKLRKGSLHESLTDAIKLKELGELLGIDLETAFDTSVPEEVQKHALAELFDLITHEGLFNKIKEGGRNVLAILPLLWLTYNYPYQTGSLCAAAVGLYYYTNVLIPSERSMIVMVNSMAAHGTRLLKNFVEEDSPVEKLLAKVPNHPQKEALAEFLALCQEHLNKIEKPIAIFSIFDANEVYTFICTNERFINYLCSGDFERADKRLTMVYEQLRRAHDPKELPHAEAYQQFSEEINSLEDGEFTQLMQALPHQSLLLLGEFRPQLLWNQYDFIAIISLNEGLPDTMYRHLLAACRLAKKLDK